MRNRFMGYIIILLLSLFMVSCAGEEAKPPAPTKPPEAKVKKTEETPPELRKAEAEPPFSYDPRGKPEPFKPFVEIMPPKPPAPPPVMARRPSPKQPGVPKAPVARAQRVPTGPPSPLQKFEINQLKLVGIIWQVDGGRALIEDPAGKGYIVGPGTPMGLKNGIITKIEPDRVIVEEEEEDAEGKVNRREVVLRLGGK